MTELDGFRSEWKTEIETKTINEAVEMWLQAEAFESDGDFNRAIQCYRKAEKIDSDVYTKVREFRPERIKPTFGGEYEKVGKSSLESQDLVEDLSKLSVKQESPFSNIFCELEPYAPSRPSMANFPREVTEKVFSHLAECGDLVSIGRLGQACKFLHKRAHDEKLWRIGCQNVFDIDSLVDLVKIHGSYRTVFLKTPKPNLTDGVYVGKQSYWREGEQVGWSYVAQHVIYRRYVRLFPNHEAIVICSADDPKVIMRKISISDFKKLSGLRRGSWHYSPKTKEVEVTITDMTQAKTSVSTIRWALAKSGRRLSWMKYFHVTLHREGTEDSEFEYDIREFPPLDLYRV